ncbi:TRAP transporter small permease [Mesorhizobium sp. J428]|uniref:TRAP transporter small permease n=1 Tax=Mesorhizobium sp. J428 TaxID=2898440 RepID=UPI002151B1DD|nr:TRAP transporter small permease [Mesorhizobium sp. J428]MCR5855812.1 TRAP transporter small permease [Mesorhizobium sp. J428]
MRFWRAIWAFEWGLAAVGAGSMLFIMMMVTVISVAGRYFLQMDLIPGAYNIVERILFPLLVFWAMPIAHRDGLFPRLETFADAQPPRRRALIAAVAMIVEIAVYAVFMWFIFRFVWGSIVQNRTMQIGTNFLPLWPILVMMPLAFGLMILEMARLLYRDMRRLLGLPVSGAADVHNGSSAV